MNIFKKQQNVTNLTDKNLIVVEKINVWAKSFQNQIMKDFVNNIKITDILYSPTDIISVSTMFESRETVKDSIPYNSKKDVNSKYSVNGNPPVVKPWDLPLTAPPLDYQNHNFSHPLPEYSYVENCSFCKGIGNFECKSCSGKGSKTCTTCSGTGYINCTSCSGTGTKNCIYCQGIGWHDKTNPTTNNYERVTCIYCLGLRTVRCTSCQFGKNNCTSCSGSKIVKCDNCHGKGHIVCKNCAGGGKILWNTLVQQNFLSIKNNSFYIFPEIKKHFNDFLPDSSESNHTMEKVIEFENMGQIMIPQSISTLPDYYLSNYEYTDILKNFIQEEILKSKEGKLVKQKIEFYQSDSYKVKYQYQSKEYILLVDLYGDKVHAPESPFSEMALDLVFKVKEKISKNEYGEALRIAKQALVLGKGSSCETDIQLLIDKIASKMFGDYKKGITFGLIVNWLVHILINVVLVIKKDSLNYWKFIFPSIICVLLYIAMKFFEPQIKKFVSKIAFPYVIGNTIARILIGGGLSTIIVSVFVYVVTKFLM